MSVVSGQWIDFSCYLSLPLPPFPESQWDPPPEFHELHQQYASYYQAQYKRQLAATSGAGVASTYTGIAGKRPAEEADVEEPAEAQKLPRRPAGPYGGWTTVTERYRIDIHFMGLL